MTPDELRLAALLLDMAADEFGNHGCNDFDTAEFLPLDVRDGIVRESWGEDEFRPYNGSGPDWRIQDWEAMQVMAERLRTLASQESAHKAYGVIITDRKALVDSVMSAQADLQTGLGIFRLDRNDTRGLQHANLVEDRLARSLARLHVLLADLGTPMYQPAMHPDVEASDS